MPFPPSHRGRVAAVLAAVALLPGCTGEPSRPASGDPGGTSLILGTTTEPATLDPRQGYAPHGAALVYDGLVEHQPDGGLKPTLAAAAPVPAADGRSWTVALRNDVSFTDGSGFDSTAVVATYRSVLEQTSPLRAEYEVLAGVQAVDKTTVRFDLVRPDPDFPDLLTLGVVATDAQGQLVGTGPYKVASWVRQDRLELVANQAYFAGPPAITKVTIRFLPDDDTRAEAMRAGELDGTVLPPALAEGFETADGLAVVEHGSTDLRAVALTGSPVAADPAVRKALNLAVDREALVRDALRGKGEVASLPVPPQVAELVEPTAALTRDVAAANQLLDAAGWVVGADGTRARAGQRLAFPVSYDQRDQVDRDLVTAFAKQVGAIGVEVTPTPAAAQAAQTPSVTSFGDPFRTVGDLRPRFTGAVAQALASADAATDPAQRAVEARAAQRAYAVDPTLVVLAQVDHTYVLRQNWTGYRPVVDATGTDQTWGPWWNLATWTPR
ncbi:ABC transporter substrate-binding protein [Actinokineospora bangkokensis]|uniref:Solute-binding protein family 5 domain-containing protein n=1 Tax=Actinokineospora bangkokensis TaxID=1193682 RepID=A0A1Q9LQD0_9PSEU|nr:ABC transporter substrate-binding protein [Actinokineospora bangkokensis]OLR94230.1 hypothetical protein BJP25_10600 [Actinokineospora bangkokensis]